MPPETIPAARRSSHPDGQPTVLVSAGDELALVTSVLEAFGAPVDVAAVQGHWLVEADLRGHPSHGIQRLPTLVGRMERGLIDPAAEPDLAWRTDSVLAVDGRRGLGPVVAMAALEPAIERVRRSGIVIVAIRNANHLGILAPYVEAVASEGLIAIAMTTSEALVHPWGGQVAMVGTNPLAVGVPAEPHALVLDMATGAVSMGRILNHLRLGRELDPGWAVDNEGAPTTDPLAASQGAISPFGGAKGYALGLALEVLVATLTASVLGPDVAGTLDVERVCNKGDVFICIDPVTIRPTSSVGDVSGYLDAVRSSAPQPGSTGVRIPGERAAAERERRRAEGIELDAAIWSEVQTLAAGGHTGRAIVSGPHPSVTR